jgi:hypothetical protein
MLKSGAMSEAIAEYAARAACSVMAKNADA